MTLIETYFAAGDRVALGSHRFTAEAIVAFASAFDPQRFHVDAEAARNSVFGGLCASGWHTTAVWMKKNVEHMQTLQRRWHADGLAPLDLGPSPGVRDLRWLRPVYAGEEIAFFSATTGERPLASRPGWHVLEQIGEAETVEGKPVLRFEAAVLVRPETESERN